MKIDSKSILIKLTNIIKHKGKKKAYGVKKIIKIVKNLELHYNKQHIHKMWAQLKSQIDEIESSNN